MSLLLLGKVASIERAVARAREEYAAAGSRFSLDFPIKMPRFSMSCAPAKRQLIRPTS